MHRHDTSSEVLTQAIVRYAIDRIRLDPPPLDGPRTPVELQAMAGHTITERGIGGLEALRVFGDVLAPACISVDHPRFLSFVPAAPTEASILFDLVVGASSIYAGSWLEGGGAVFAENHSRLLSEPLHVGGNLGQPTFIECHLIQFTLKIGRALNNVAFPIHNQPNDRSFHLDQLRIVRQLKERRMGIGGGAARLIAHGAKHGYGRDPGVAQTVDDALQAHLRIQPAEVVHVDERDLVAVQFGEGRRTGTQTTGPSDGPVEILTADQQLCGTGQGQAIDIFDC